MNTATMARLDGDDRKTYFISCLQRGLVRRFAHPDVSHDVFDLNDRIIDENSGAESDRQQSYHVE